MAAAFSLTGSYSCSLAVLGVGPFGERVARLMLDAHDDAVAVAVADLIHAFAVARDAVVVAVWRTEHRLLEQADLLSRRHGRPWLPICMEHRAIRIGPLVTHESPCFRCYQRRREQHDVQPAATAALLSACAANESFGPQGFLPHHARIAAMLGCDMLRSLDTDAGGIGAGRVATIRLPGDGIRMNGVVGCHDCDRCGGPPGPVGDLQAALAGLHRRPRSSATRASFTTWEAR